MSADNVPAAEPVQQPDYRLVALLNLQGLTDLPLVEQQHAIAAVAQAYATIALADAVDRLTAQVQKVTGP